MCFIGMMKNSEFLSSHSFSCFLEIKSARTHEEWSVLNWTLTCIFCTLSLSILFYGEERCFFVFSVKNSLCSTEQAVSERFGFSFML
jgi:hypothetical protein